MIKKRSHFDIIGEILQTITEKRGRIKQTHLMYKVNLSHQLMKSCLEELISRDMIQETRESNNIYIVIKEPGLVFLKKFKKMREFQDAFGL